MEVPAEKVIYLHGFSREELFRLVDVIKKSVDDPKEIAFATSTKNNLEMTVKQLISEVRSDHNYMVYKIGTPPEPKAKT